MATRTHFALCMHFREWRHQKTGTGRLTHLALTHSRVFPGFDFDGDAAFQALLADPRFAPHLLFPGPGAVDLSEGQKPELPPGRALLVVLLDATWPWAKRMLRANRSLQALPCLKFTPRAPSRFLIKRQPHPACVSTIEAAYELLCTLTACGLEDAGLDLLSMIDTFQDMVAYQVKRKQDAPSQS